MRTINFHVLHALHLNHRVDAVPNRLHWIQEPNPWPTFNHTLFFEGWRWKKNVLSCNTKSSFSRSQNEPAWCFIFNLGLAAWRTRTCRNCSRAKIRRSSLTIFERSAMAPSALSTMPGTTSPRRSWPSRRCLTAGSNPWKSGKIFWRKFDFWGDSNIRIVSRITDATWRSTPFG